MQTSLFKLSNIQKVIFCIVFLLCFSLLLYSVKDKSPGKDSISGELQAWRDSAVSFQFNGYNISYHDTNQTSKEVLVLIHGYPTSSFDWHLIWDSLSQHYRVIAIDMLGFGFSDKPSDIEYSILLQSDIHESLFRHLDVNKFHILAHDYGDNVAQELLSRLSERQEYPFDVMSATLLNGGLFPSTHKPTVVQSLLASPLGPIVSRLVNQSLFSKSFSNVFGEFTKPSKQELIDQWFLICQNGGNKINYKLVHATRDREANKERWKKSLTSNLVPILLIAGLQDPVAGIETVEKYIKIVPDPKVIKLNSIGHFPQIEAPQQVIGHVEYFIESAENNAVNIPNKD